MEDKARYVAVKTLYSIVKDGSYSNIKLNENFKSYELVQIDRAFATEILYGTIRWKMKIDYLLQKFSKTKLTKVSPWVLCCLRTAVYQIYFMDKVPDFAAVNQAVEIAKIKEKRSSSFVNGILRNILRNKEEFYNINILDKKKRMAVEFSHPQWLVEKFVDDFGEDFTIDLIKKNNTPPDFVIRTNTLKCSRDELKEILKSKGIEVFDGSLEEAIIVKGYGMIEKSEEFNNGLFTIQDEGSMLVSKVLDPMPGEKIIDMCSAPGGKSTHCAQLMQNKGEILSLDIYEHKIKLIEKTARRLGIDIIMSAVMDSSILNQDFLDVADKVLVDAPCSGIGLIRKKPEIRWNISNDDILELQSLQYKILICASKYVKKGGHIVYSTCTITKEENEDILKKFLEENDNFSLEDISNLLLKKFSTNISSKGFIKLFPNIHGTDGFFIAKLKRNW